MCYDTRCQGPMPPPAGAAVIHRNRCITAPRTWKRGAEFAIPGGFQLLQSSPVAPLLAPRMWTPTRVSELSASVVIAMTCDDDEIVDRGPGAVYPWLQTSAAERYSGRGRRRSKGTLFVSTARRMFGPDGSAARSLAAAAAFPTEEGEPSRRPPGLVGESHGSVSAARWTTEPEADTTLASVRKPLGSVRRCQGFRVFMAAFVLSWPAC